MSGVPSTAENAVTAPPAAGGEVASANSTQDSSVLVTGVPLCPPHPPATAPAAPAAPAPVSGQPAAQQTEQPTQVTVSLPVATQGVAPLPAQFALSCGHPAQPGGAAGVVPAVTHASPFALPPGSQVAPMLQHMPPPLAPLQPSAAAAAPVASVSSAPVAGPTVPYHDLLLRRQDQWSNFPAGLRVLVADNDPASLQQVEKMLKKCSYKVTLCSSGKNSLEILRKRREEFDLVLADANLPDIDGFKLLAVCNTELSLPVVLMASSDDTQLVMRGILEGARDILIKPLRVEELRVLWQHLVRSTSELTKTEVRLPASVRDELMDGNIPYGEASTNQQPMDRDSDGNTSKKQRMIWTQDMHEQFVNAVEQLGIDKAVPKRILDLMTVEGLTRENVASHLQKYRLYLKRMVSNPDTPQPVMGGDTMVGAEAAYRGSTLSGKPLPRMGQQQQQAVGTSPETGVVQTQHAQVMTTHQYSAPPGPQPPPGTMLPPPPPQQIMQQPPQPMQPQIQLHPQPQQQHHHHYQQQQQQQQVQAQAQMGVGLGMVPAGHPHPHAAAHMHMAPPGHHMMQVMGPNGQMMVVAAPQQMARPGVPQQVMGPPPPQMGMAHGQMVHIQHSQAPGSAPMHPEIMDPRNMQHMPQFVTPDGVPVAMPHGAMPHMEFSYGQPQHMAGWPVQGQPSHQT
eukprot:CAMPEP_0177795074 /NCGR_PEP_ID=MMETSP0491_2-20121128/26015_1 /TAXON_ID=63592 /ORGANISM="Tetraselmis chuii, Strain PLY429" /LENGTH=678 /DNA_ID=CAMNT_0019317833 /DNA_START=295 /DNA_END=2334 /DNA_ORIENTATION=+